MAQSAEVEAVVTAASIKTTSGKQKQLDGALETISEHYSATLAVWGKLTAEQRAELLAHSPLLASLVELLRPIYGS